MTGLEELKYQLSVRLGILRSLHRFLDSQEFTDFFESADADSKAKALALIKNEDRDGLFALVKRSRDLTVKQLRHMCRMRNVKNYHLLTKAELLSILERLL